MRAPPRTVDGPETEWSAAPAAVVRELVEAAGVLGQPRLCFRLGGPRDVVVAAHIPAELAARAPGLLPAPSAEATVDATLYLATGGGASTIRRRFPARRAATSFIGVYDDAERVYAVAGDTSLGLLRSLIFGLASGVSLSGGWVPAHGCLLDVGAGAALIGGGHGSGKSTALAEIMRRVRGREHVAVWTDDWPCFAAWRTDWKGARFTPLSR
jgi:hypothetical protein